MNPITLLAKTIKENTGQDLYKQENLMGDEVYWVDGQTAHISVANGQFGRYDRWQWNLPPDRPHVDLLILIAINRDGTQHYFIVDGADTNNCNRYEINSHPTRYRGHLARYLEQWSAITEGVAYETG